MRTQNDPPAEWTVPAPMVCHGPSGGRGWALLVLFLFAVLPNARAWEPFGNGMDDAVSALAVDGTHLYAGGSFFMAGTASVSRAAQWSGSGWSTLGDGLGGSVSCMAHDGSRLYVGGSFSMAGSVPVQYVAAWDGSSWTNLGDGIGGYGVYSMLCRGGNLYVGGYFTNAGGVAANNIAMWNGSSWTNLGDGITGGYGVQALAHDGTNLYAAGPYANQAGSLPINSIAMWNGSSWTNLGDGLQGQPLALAHDGLNLYAGGFITMAGDVPVTNIAKWNGSNWTNLADGVGSPFNGVFALLCDGPNLYAGGTFDRAGDATVTNIAAWNGTNWASFGAMNDAVYTLALMGSNVVAGGTFTSADGIPANRIAQTPALPKPPSTEPQSISNFFPASGSRFRTNAVLGLSAQGGASGNPVVFTLVSGPATLSGTNLSFNALGTVLVSASQAGNAFYDPAPTLTNAYQIVPPEYCVATNGNDTNDGLSWETPKQTIQAAVDIAPRDGTVWVSNGVYDTGGGVVQAGFPNRVSLTNGIDLVAVNGPDLTSIVGTYGVRVVYMQETCLLSGFTITGGAGVHTGGIWGDGGTVSNSFVRNNKGIMDGGGVRGVTLINCILRENESETSPGGAAYRCTLINCLLVDNIAATYGGAAEECALYNCTLVGNRTFHNYYSGGTVWVCGIYNCIFWGNGGAVDVVSSGVFNSCVERGIEHGPNGNITNNPLFVDASAGNFVLSPFSPCIDAGSNAHAPTNATPVDLAGNPRIIGAAVDMGARESRHLYVSTNGNDSADGLTWATAKRNLQPAVDASWAGMCVAASNGVYSTGATTNAGGPSRLSLTNGVSLFSANGTNYTTLAATNGIRGAYLAAGSRLTGFTIRNANITFTGGGAYLESGASLSDCLITQNRAAVGGGVYGGTIWNSTLRENQSPDGGGASRSTLNHCRLIANRNERAGDRAGGAFRCTLNNCILTDHWGSNAGAAGISVLNNCTLFNNHADYGGALFYGEANNCILWGNGATYQGSILDATVRNSCSDRDVVDGVNGNTTNAPLFLDASIGNFALEAGSPCIDAGNNSSAPTLVSSTDLAGNPRIVNRTVDMGAFEFQEANTYFIAQNGQTPQAPYTNWSAASSNFSDAILSAPYAPQTGFRRAFAIEGAIYADFFGIQVGPGDVMGSTLLQPSGLVLAPATGILATNAAYVGITGPSSAFLSLMMADMAMPRPPAANQTAGFGVDGCKVQFSGAAAFKTNAAPNGNGQRKLIVANCGKLEAKSITNQWDLSLRKNGALSWNPASSGGRRAASTDEQKGGELWAQGYADLLDGSFEATSGESGESQVAWSNFVHIAEDAALGLRAQRVSGSIHVEGGASGIAQALVQAFTGSDADDWHATLSGSISNGVLQGGATLDILGGIVLDGDAQLDARLSASGTNEPASGGVRAVSLDLDRLAMAPSSTVRVAENTPAQIVLDMGAATTLSGTLQDTIDSRSGSPLRTQQHRYSVSEGGNALAVRCGDALLRAETGLSITGIVIDTERNLDTGETESRTLIQLSDGSSMEVYRDPSGVLLPTFLPGTRPNVVVDSQDVEGITTFVVRDITPMFQENGPPETGGGNILRWTSFTNRLYTVWLATNASTDYAPLQSNIPASPAVNVYTDSTPRPFSFYKVTTEK